MKKTRKVQLLATILGATAVVAGLALLNAPVQASAAETAAFAMENGASVRAVKDQAGIRWITNVDKAWYEANLKNATDVSFGTWVTSADNVSSVTELNENFDTEVKDLVCKGTPDWENETTFTYYSSILYTAKDLEGVELKAYATELIARSYVKYSPDNGVTYKYIYADSNDNQRCMRAVALAAYNDETEEKLDADEKLVVEDYFESKNNDVDFADYYETAAPEEVSTYSVAYLGAKKVGEVNEGKLTIDDGLTLGDNYTLTLFDASGNYAKTEEFQYVTAALDKSNFATYITTTGTISGYYVLKDNIDLSKTDYTYYGVNNTFKGTLDGNGKTISGLNVNQGNGYPGGLFKTLQGTVKNVAVIGSLSATGGLIAGTCNTGATIQNVYVDASLSNASSAGVLARQCTVGTVENVVIKVNWNTKGTPGAVFSHTGMNATKIKNCYYISVDGLTPLRQGWSSTTYCWMGNKPETVLGTAKTSGNVTTYTKTDGTMTVTGYTAADLDTAKAAFAAALTDTENPISLSKEAKALFLKANPNP